MQAIDPNLDFGNGLSVTEFALQVNKLESFLAVYHKQLSLVDMAKNDTDTQEKVVRELSERMLESFGARYNHYSNEYEMAGGTRKGDNRRKVNKKPKKTA